MQQAEVIAVPLLRRSKPLLHVAQDALVHKVPKVTKGIRETPALKVPKAIPERLAPKATPE
jgi:hypothetical protein